jgi:WD40 repeat protein
MSKNQKCEFLFVHLPSDIIINILNFIGNIKDIVSFCNHNKSMKYEIENNKMLSKFTPNFRIILIDKWELFFKKTGLQHPANFSFFLPLISDTFTLIHPPNPLIKSVYISTNNLIVIVSFNNTLSIWCNSTYKYLKIFKFPEAVTSLCSLYNNHIACATKVIYIISLNTLELKKKLIEHENSVLNMISYGRRLLSISIDGKLKSWNLETCKYISGHDHFSYNPLLCKIHTGFAVVGDQKNQYISLVKHGKGIQYINTIGSTGSIECICMFNDGFACGHSNGSIFIDSNKVFQIDNAHSSKVTCLIQYMNLNVLISSSTDGSIKVWNISTECTCIETIYVHTKTIQGIAIDSKGNIISVSDDGFICITSTLKRLKIDNVPKLLRN